MLSTCHQFRKWLLIHWKACWFAQKHNKKGSQGLNQNKLSNAQDVTPPTQNSATTTTTASLSQDTSANLAGGIGPKAAHSEMFRWVEGAGKTNGRHPRHQREAKINH